MLTTLMISAVSIIQFAAATYWIVVECASPAQCVGLMIVSQSNCIIKMSISSSTSMLPELVLFSTIEVKI